MDRDADDECPFVTFQRLPSSDFPTDIDTINILYSIKHTFSPFAPSSWIVHCVIIWATYWMSFCKVLKCSTSSFSKVTAFDTIQNRIQACMRPGQCPRYILNFCTCIVTLIISLMISMQHFCVAVPPVLWSALLYVLIESLTDVKTKAIQKHINMKWHPTNNIA